MSFAFIPSPNINNPPTPPPPPTPKHLIISTIWSSRQFITREWFRTLYKFVHEVRTITICFYACDIIFVSDDICAKIPRKLNYESKKIQILGENGINAKLKHRKAHNLDFIREIWWPVRETGRLVMYPGELVCMQLIAVLSGPLILADLLPILLCQYSLVSVVIHYLITCLIARLPELGIENWEKVMRFPKFPRREVL